MVFLQDSLSGVLLPLLFCFLFWGIMVVLSGVIVKLKSVKENKEGFECGFDMFNKSSSGGFCVRFFNIAILFILIDMEIAILFPLVLGGGLASSGFNILMVSSLCFFFLGSLLLIELKMGGVSWAEEI